MSKRKIIDLTHPIHTGMTYYPRHWHPQVEVSLMGQIPVEGRETRKLVLGTHSGTHIDAATHFIKTGKTIDEVDLDNFIGLADVVDLTPCKPLEEIPLPRLREKFGGKEPLPRVILRYDWSRRYAEPDFYSRSPFLSRECCRWLVEKGVRVLGMDTPSPDNPADDREAKVDSPNHKILLGGGASLVEYLCNLDQITSARVELIALPIKIQGGDGAPARVVAVEYED